MEKVEITTVAVPAVENRDEVAKDLVARLPLLIEEVKKKGGHILVCPVGNRYEHYSHEDPVLTATVDYCKQNHYKWVAACERRADNSETITVEIYWK